VMADAGREIGYTTVLKVLQIMTEKGLVVRDESARTHIYAPASTEDQTQRQMVSDLLDRVFDGSQAKLVMQALAAKKTTPEELAEIRKLLNKPRGEEQ
jgi:predicted transcriptional regulator